MFFLLIQLHFFLFSHESTTQFVARTPTYFAVGAGEALRDFQAAQRRILAWQNVLLQKERCLKTMQIPLPAANDAAISAVPLPSEEEREKIVTSENEEEPPVPNKKTYNKITFDCTETGCDEKKLGPFSVKLARWES